MSDYNPFAAFAYTGNQFTSASPLQKPEPEQTLAASNSRDERSRIETKTGHDPLCLWSGVNHYAPSVSMKRPRVELDKNDVVGLEGEEVAFSPSRCIAEYELIARYRRTHRSTVDGFNAFLLSLHGTEGRYWALVACLLSVQCLDEVALKAVRKLMATTAEHQETQAASRASDLTTDDAPNSTPTSSILSVNASAEAVLALDPGILESHFATLNFRKAKERFVTESSRAILDKWGGKVPESYKDLLSLPGVGPKIANLMRSVAFGKEDAGIVVDTHVHRVARLLEWVPTGAAPAAAATTTTNKSAPSASLAAPIFARGSQRANGNGSDGPEKTRAALETWVPYSQRAQFALDVVGFGQITRHQGWAAAFMRHVLEEIVDGSNDAHDNTNVRIAEEIVRKIGDKNESADENGLKDAAGEPRNMALEKIAKADLSSKKGIDEKYTCGACTFVNDWHSTKCEVCGTSRHVSSEKTAQMPEVDESRSSEATETRDNNEPEPAVSIIEPEPEVSMASDRGV